MMNEHSRYSNILQKMLLRDNGESQINNFHTK